MRLCSSQLASSRRVSLERLQDDPAFTLPDAVALASLVAAGERMGMSRQSTALAANYVQRYPRRFDGLELGLGAAIAFADRLGEPDRARALLQQAATLAGDGPEADRIRRLQQRLDAGDPLGARLSHGARAHGALRRRPVALLQAQGVAVGAIWG